VLLEPGARQLPSSGQQAVLGCEGFVLDEKGTGDLIGVEARFPGDSLDGRGDPGAQRSRVTADRVQRGSDGTTTATRWERSLSP
jgi:hypothetical protein